ncbi:putative NADH-dependent flavin oxidoreductase [Ascobolus immersus RN42]|uniref:Putative NADH-dependent flavin oxidoreductase n=1 Tax=Ascobolus immersus RN42 TaxID=1160509 RepID=A0A3N4HJD3_ASCIM|nr:putative NADH-dependent flavin oxidoreductase [Ascobolus immersus RN42]
MATTAHRQKVNNPVKAAEGIPYFTAAQEPAPGTFIQTLDGKPQPKLFEPITIRGTTFQNRIWVAPMCQYSASATSTPTNWHISHLGSLAIGGAGLIIIEATAVAPIGRLSPHDLGLWSRDQLADYKNLTTFIHSQSCKIGIQLGHAGRKASCPPPWITFGGISWPEEGGWPDEVVGPSGGPEGAYSEQLPVPKELTVEEIQQVVADFGKSAALAVEAGFDAIEIHAAHGYLISSFLSPASNKRTDAYGGSFEGRTRIVFEVIESIRKNVPESMPLFIRFSASDNLENNPAYTGESWKIEDTVQLAQLIQERAVGVDLIDVSSGGNHPLQKLAAVPGYQVHMAAAIREGLKSLPSYSEPSKRVEVGTVGLITTGTQAEEILQKGDADVILVGRGFLKDRNLVFSWAEELGTEVEYTCQNRWVFQGRGPRKVVKKVEAKSEKEGTTIP